MIAWSDAVMERWSDGAMGVFGAFFEVWEKRTRLTFFAFSWIKY